MLSELQTTKQPKSTIELGYMCPRGLFGQLVETLTMEWLKFKKKFLQICTYNIFKSDF